MKPSNTCWRAVGLVILGFAIVAASGCAGVRARQTTTSVVDYLYPDARDPVAEQGIPVLTLPMRVGIAFVPEKMGHESLTEAKKAELLERVAANFRTLEFIKSI